MENVTIEGREFCYIGRKITDQQREWVRSLLQATGLQHVRREEGETSGAYALRIYDTLGPKVVTIAAGLMMPVGMTNVDRVGIAANVQFFQNLYRAESKAKFIRMTVDAVVTFCQMLCFMQTLNPDGSLRNIRCRGVRTKPRARGRR